jgi:hypothetical protein
MKCAGKFACAGESGTDLTLWEDCVLRYSERSRRLKVAHFPFVTFLMCFCG